MLHGQPVEVCFSCGDIVLRGLPVDGGMLKDIVSWDAHIAGHRAAAVKYADILRRLHGHAQYRDAARAYHVIACAERHPLPLRPYQEQALRAWIAARRRGVVVLPTGAGKSYVALRAITACQRTSLVVVPTIDLMHQWAADLEQRLDGCRVGRYGGGAKDFGEITIATYDSAVSFMSVHGSRFGLVIFDECHHLPAATTSNAARQCLAPFRLGLTATPERSDGLESLLDELVGPCVFRTNIKALAGKYLAHYRTEVIEVPLAPDEAAIYATARAQYISYLKRVGIDVSAPGGWQRFLVVAARDNEGRSALAAWHTQQKLARANRAKLAALWNIIIRHAGERILIFTDDNETAYDIGRHAILPVLTHRTPPRERQSMLDAFRSGRWPVLVTSRVLNEGIDVPDAAVGIVVSGTGSAREHAQRLGRILRAQPGKHAVLYELISAHTAELSTHLRRAQHISDGDDVRP